MVSDSPRPNFGSDTNWRARIVPFLCWLALMIAGFAYVSVALCGRKNPIESGNGIFDFLVLLLASPLLYALGPRRNWPPPNKSLASVLSWNLLSYAFPFFLLLHWEYLGHAIGSSFSLTPHHMASLDRTSAFALVAAVCTMLGIVAIHFLLAKRCGILRPYALSFFVVPLIVLVITILLRQSYYVHIHHYCLGLFLFPFFRFRRPISVVAQASFLGLAIEGIARWGADPVWYLLN